MMGDKITAKQAVKEAGIPVVPGSDGAITTEEEAFSAAREIGFPVLIKAAAGGGGRGMKVARTEEDLAEAVSTARAEAKAAFGDDAIYMERYLQGPRHIELQVIADRFGNVCHLGERDCSLQRRHQKILEEAPSPALSAAERVAIGETVNKAIAAIGYLGVGTIEFLWEDGEFFFIEMNTRLQVEHPVTEMITGVDLVREQIRIAAGLPLSFKQSDVTFNGHAIECRINAENAETFTPSPGTITDFHAPGGLGVRLDSAIFAGYSIPPYYDSLIGKLIVHGRDREECIARLKRSLNEMVVGGIDTTIPLFQKLLQEPDILSGDYDIHWLENWAKRQKGEA
jgi:acetyl-CoA carboxylase biotin carboxylase subunit